MQRFQSIHKERFVTASRIRTSLGFFFLLVTSLIFLACDFIRDFDKEKGNLRFEFSLLGSNFFQASSVAVDIVHLESGETKDQSTSIDESSGKAATDFLKVFTGTWTMTVTVYDDAGSSIISSSTTVEVVVNATITAAVTMNYSDGQYRFTWDTEGIPDPLVSLDPFNCLWVYDKPDSPENDDWRSSTLMIGEGELSLVADVRVEYPDGFASHLGFPAKTASLSWFYDDVTMDVRRNDSCIEGEHRLELVDLNGIVEAYSDDINLSQPDYAGSILSPLYGAAPLAGVDLPIIWTFPSYDHIAQVVVVFIAPSHFEYAGYAPTNGTHSVAAAYLVENETCELAVYAIDAEADLSILDSLAVEDQTVDRIANSLAMNSGDSECMVLLRRTVSLIP